MIVPTIVALLAFMMFSFFRGARPMNWMVEYGELKRLREGVRLDAAEAPQLRLRVNNLERDLKAARESAEKLGMELRAAMERAVIVQSFRIQQLDAELVNHRADLEKHRADLEKHRERIKEQQALIEVGVSKVVQMELFHTQRMKPTHTFFSGWRRFPRWGRV